jgi:hypothetical protein
MTLSTYAHLFDEHDGADHRPAEEQIRAARLATVSPEVSVLCPRPRHALNSGKEKPRISRVFSKPTPGLEPGTPSLRVKWNGDRISTFAGILSSSLFAWCAQIAARIDVRVPPVFHDSTDSLGCTAHRS